VMAWSCHSNSNPQVPKIEYREMNRAENEYEYEYENN